MAVLVVIPCQDELEAASNALRSMISDERGDEVKQIGPFHYAWSSGLAQTVEQEIELAFSSNDRSKDEEREFIDFVGIGDRLSQRIDHLSGGWRKYLIYSLSIWLSDPDAPIVVFASSQFLDDDLISKLLDNCDRRTAKTFLFELDPLIMDRWAFRMDVLLFNFEEEAETQWTEPYVKRFGEGSIVRL